MRNLLFLFLCSSPSIFTMERDIFDPVIEAKNRYLIHLCKNEGAFSFIPAVWRKSVAKLLAEGANIDCLSEADGYHHDGEFTPLSFAARFGQYEKCKILLELGADVNASHARITPLAAAIKPGARRKEALFQLMMAYGADLNIRSTQTGQTPLMLLVREYVFLRGVRLRWPDCVYPSLEDILKLGADPLIADHQGNNALFHAVDELFDRASNPIAEFTTNSPLFILLKFLVWQKYNQHRAFFAFLCCAKKMKQSNNQYNRSLGEVLYQNRKIIWDHLWILHQQSFPSLRDALERVNCADRTVRRYFCKYYKLRSDDLSKKLGEFSIDLLDPEEAESTELLLLDHCRRDVERQKQEVLVAPQNQCGCILQ